jgi:hypothetical protein
VDVVLNTRQLSGGDDCSGVAMVRSILGVQQQFSQLLVSYTVLALLAAVAALWRASIVPSWHHDGGVWVGFLVVHGCWAILVLIGRF